MSTDGRSAPMLDPATLMQMSFSFAASRILSTAVQLDIFSSIAGCARVRPLKIARVAQISERGTAEAERFFSVLTRRSTFRIGCRRRDSRTC